MTNSAATCCRCVLVVVAFACLCLCLLAHTVVHTCVAGACSWCKRCGLSQPVELELGLELVLALALELALELVLEQEPELGSAPVQLLLVPQAVVELPSRHLQSF